MIEEVKYEDIEFQFPFKADNLRVEPELPEYEHIYQKIKSALKVEGEGNNVYIIDNFSNEKLDKIMEYIKSILSDRNPPKDICYCITEDEKEPKVLFLSNGKGIELNEILTEIQNSYYECTYEFYNNSVSKKKEQIINNVQKIKNERISKLAKMAENDGFEIKSTSTGFTFIPLMEERIMTEKEFDMLEAEKKNDIVDKVNSLKIFAKDIIHELKDIEDEEIKEIKDLLEEYYDDRIMLIRNRYSDIFFDDVNIISYLNTICDDIKEELLENYTTDFEEDEESINKIIYKYKINILVDNRGVSCPRVIFENDPKISNLLGCIEYENQNGTYATDISFIKVGSMLHANEGCLIVRMSSLLENPSAYFYLKKSILNKKIDLDFNKGYLDILPIKSIHPEPIPIDEKIIIIGDYETYDILYNYDEDFKKIFGIRAEYNPLIQINEENKNILVSNIYRKCKQNNLKNITYKGLREVAKYLSRKAEDRRKLYYDDFEINKILNQANYKAESEEKKEIDEEDISNTIYDEEIFEKEMFKNYEDKKILIDVNNRMVGQINGLSVIDYGYCSYGKPLKITCTCYKGEGNIIDVQKESSMSGNIHSKSINILKGCISNVIYGYDKLPVDFHLCFEQLYGKIDGDSASVAEIICMLSALSKIPIRQDIAVTGSINQFGKVQPIGGVNEKIEGFHKVCKIVDNVEGKGVLIPKKNQNDIILKNEVEEALKEGKFHIYLMTDLEDAVNLLMGTNSLKYDDILEIVQKEIKKYNPSRKK